MYRELEEVFDIIDPITDQRIFLRRIEHGVDSDCKDCYFFKTRMGWCGFSSLERKLEVLGNCTQYDKDPTTSNSIFKKVNDTDALKLIIK